MRNRYGSIVVPSALVALALAACGDPEAADAGEQVGRKSKREAAREPACDARPLDGDDTVMHFHHVHMNSSDPEADIAFFEQYYPTRPIDFCERSDGEITRAVSTERAYLLFTQVDEPPDPTPNTYLEHIGWSHPDPAGELQRLAMLGAPLSPEGRGQCDTAAAGEAPCNDYWFYLTAPNGARAEIARGPGPATMGFGHVHVIMGEDFGFFERVSAGAFHDNAIGEVNMINSLAPEDLLAEYDVVDTRGKPIDHLAYSTLDLEAARDRIVDEEGIELAEDISFKPDYGFRSFFVKSPKGTWLEIVEDAPYAP